MTDREPVYGCFLCERRTRTPEKHERRVKLTDGKTVVLIECPECQRKKTEREVLEAVRGLTGRDVARFL